jgi:hypothetical protein
VIHFPPGIYDLGIPGGRQLDGAIPALYALEQICKSPRIKEAQRSGQLTVFFDSGVRTGTDMFKALALGAQAILRECPITLYSFCNSFYYSMVGIHTQDELARLGCLIVP